MRSIENKDACVTNTSYGDVICSFNTCKLAKEKGILVSGRNYYEYALTSQIDEETGDHTGTFGWKKGELNLQNGYMSNEPKYNHSTESWFICVAYSQHALRRILEEMYNIHINIIYLPEDDLYDCRVVESNWRGVFRKDCHKGMEDCLQEALKLIEV